MKYHYLLFLRTLFLFAVLLCASTLAQSQDDLKLTIQNSIKPVLSGEGPTNGPRGEINKNKTRDIIFADTNFEIAMTKSYETERVITGCQTCTLLALRDLTISETDKKYADKWAVSLAINDINFEYLVPELIQNPNYHEMRLLSADEQNHLLAGHKPVGHIKPIHLFTIETYQDDGGDKEIFDLDYDYREILMVYGM